MEKSSRKKLFGDDYNSSPSSNYSSLQKSRSNMTTLERKDSKSPRPNQAKPRKTLSKNLSPELLKIQLEQRIIADHQQHLKDKDKIQKEGEVQKTESKHQKFGIRVLPIEQQQKSPKIIEQNENNLNIEKRMEISTSMTNDGADELQPQPPTIKKRERKSDASPEKGGSFDRNSLNGSGIKRDSNGIPQELPSHMFNAAVAVKRNRNSTDLTMEDDGKHPKRKGKAPSPPEDIAFDELEPLEHSDSTEDKEQIDTQLNSRTDSSKDYNSDSDAETDNQSSVNTIELNSSEITIHQTEDEDLKNRKTVSTGDLTKIHKARKTSNGTLERAQSLDISDSVLPTLSRKHKGGNPDGDFDLIKSEEDLFGKMVLNKEPRLSLILDGLTTFQRNRLKKSTEWGNLEDAILKHNQEDDSFNSEADNISLERISLTEKTPEFDAVVNKIKEIKRESLELLKPVEIKTDPVVRNEIWPNIDSRHSSNGHAHMIPSDKPKNIEAISPKESEHCEENSLEPENLIRPVKPAVPPPPIKSIRVHNRINEPFELSTIRQPSAENRQMKPSVGLKLPPPVQSELNNSEVFKASERVNLRQRLPVQDTIGQPLPKLEDGLNETELNYKWDIRSHDGIIDTSPPTSLDHIENLDEVPPPLREVDKVLSPSCPTYNDKLKSKPTVRAEEVLSKIPLLNSMVKSQKEEPLNKTLLGTNNSDEIKTVVTFNKTVDPNLLDLTQNFLYNEKMNCGQDSDIYNNYDINISDDIKVSRHSLSDLEKQNVPKCDDAKTEDNFRHISNINVSSSVNGDQELHSLELSINDRSDLYTTALDTTDKNESIITIITPDLVKNSIYPESIKNLNDSPSHEIKSSMVEIPQEVVAISENQFSSIAESPIHLDQTSEDDNSKGNLTLTYITEIEVTPTKNLKTNISEVDIAPKINLKSNTRNIDTEFENYVKSFESKLENFENNIQDFDRNLEEFIKEEPMSITINKTVEEDEINKIHEIAEEQLKKLPEMRFSTSSYESPSKIPDKRFSQIEMLRSNFEKPSPKSNKSEVTTKSRIPIAMTSKTPPMSPERRDSRNLENENDKALLELMSSPVTSTPLTTSKYHSKPSNKNVTVTSIRSNSKIPSGLPTLTGRPPVAPRRIEVHETNVQVSTNGNTDSSFKQWVFNPTNITNVTVTEHKDK